MKRSIILLALLVLAFAAPANGALAKKKVGKEFQVNTYTTAYQRNPSAVGLSNGHFVVTWESSDGQDGDEYGVYGQRLSANGKRKGKEFRVNTYTQGDQAQSSVAALTKGRFVVVWESEGQDGSSYGIFAQRYKKNGGRKSKEFRVNTYTTSHQRYPVVAGLTDGGFVVAWESAGQDGSSNGIYAQIYNAKGKPRGSELLVNRQTANTQTDPAVSGLPKGGFVIAWTSYGQDGSEEGVFAQRYNNKGKTRGDEFQVNTHTDNEQSKPSVGGLSQGGFVVLWNSLDQDGSAFGVYGQRYNSRGKPKGKEFPVNTYTTSNQSNPFVVGLNTGGYVVAWESIGQDGGGFGVFGQRFKANGSRKGKEFPINTYTSLNQRNSAVARGPNSGFAAFWESWGAQDGDDTGIYGQRYKK